MGRGEDPCRSALLELGFARVRCPNCRAEFLVPFRCKGRHFCPSCNARRLAEWSLWLDEHLLAAVPHRQVVLTVPKRLRAYFYDRRRLALLSRAAYRTLRDYLRAALGEREAAPGAIVGLQSFRSLIHWHPHLHVLLTDGAFRRDSTFLPAPVHEPAVLEQAWRRAVLAAFVGEGWLGEEAASAMLALPHSGFGAHVGPRIVGEDRESLLRVHATPLAPRSLNHECGTSPARSAFRRFHHFRIHASRLHGPAPWAAKNRKMKQKSTAGSPLFWIGQIPCG
jgi:hypothetical protein